MKFNKLVCTAAVMMTVLSGCSETKDIRYYSLDSADYYAKTGNINNNVLFVKGVVVPEYLDSKSFVFRGRGHEIFYTNENKWIQELSVLLNDSLLKNLRNRTEKWFVTNDKSIKNNAELTVSINNFELNETMIESMREIENEILYTNAFNGKKCARIDVFEDEWDSKEVKNISWIGYILLK